jgi:hypothetical protein
MQNGRLSFRVIDEAIKTTTKLAWYILTAVARGDGRPLAIRWLLFGSVVSYRAGDTGHERSGLDQHQRQRG